MQQYELNDRIEAVQQATGEGTELVSLSIPAEKDLRPVRQRIEQEYASAENIKSDRTKDRVQQALGRVRRILRRYEATPSMGLVIYAGVVGDELTEYVFDDLSTPVTESQYECGAEFYTDPIEHVLQPEDTYGLLVVERGGAILGELRGDAIVSLMEIGSQIMGKTRAGGQSAQRFARERQRQKHEFFEQVASAAERTFIHDSSVDGLLLGGSTITASEFTDGDYLHHQLQNQLLGTFSVDHASEQGLSELVSRGEKAILDANRRETREHLSRFFSGLAGDEPVTYGVENVAQAIEYGAVETLLVSEDLPTGKIREYEQRVKAYGGSMIVVGSDFEKGEQLATVFDGVAGLLRFSVE